MTLSVSYKMTIMWKHEFVEHSGLYVIEWSSVGTCQVKLMVILWRGLI